MNERELEKYLHRLFPLNRSLTGENNRKTLKILQEIVPLKILEFPSRAKVYDWKIPDEWEVNHAYIKDRSGRKIVDFKNNNLHLLGYSSAISKVMSFGELKKHLIYNEEQPDAIPYATSYYESNWGFSISYEQYIREFSDIDDDDEFEVHIDTSFTDGSMSIGELVIQGESSKEFLISSYICHPSMANDSLSGFLLAAFYAAHILESRPKYSYRFIWVPETIGAITYLANNENIMKNIDCGLVMTTCGGPGNFSLKKSWDENHYLNGLILEVLKDNDIKADTYVFDIRGSDERQYSTQGFRINTPLLCKSKFYEYDEYHTSLDNLNFVLPCYLIQSFSLYIDIYNKLESQEFYLAAVTHGEAMLSKRKAYPSIGGRQRHAQNSCVTTSSAYLLWFIFYADGKTPLSNIAEKLKLEVSDAKAIAQDLERMKLVSKV